MKNRYIPACIMLIAGLICAIMSIVNHWDVMYSLVTLLFVLLIFYCLGCVAEYIVRSQQKENAEQRLAEEKRLEEERLEEERLAALEEESEKEEDLENNESEKASV